MAWAAAALSIFLYFLTKGLKRINALKINQAWPYIFWVPSVFLLLGTCALAFAPVNLWVVPEFQLGEMLSTPLGWILLLPEWVLSVPVGVSASFIILVLGSLAIWDLLTDKKPDGWCVAAWILIPLLVFQATGPIGNGAGQVTHGARDAANTMGTSLFSGS